MISRAVTTELAGCVGGGETWVKESMVKILVMPTRAG
jgi:hypothetical protein